MNQEKMRSFESGATRSSEEGKYDYEGFLSPRVLERYAKYMNDNRVQADGALRDSDNWQKGMGLNVYMKSMWRHFMSLWKLHRGLKDPDDKETALCALLFNVSGYMHEHLVAEEKSSIAQTRRDVNGFPRAPKACQCAGEAGMGSYEDPEETMP